MCVETTHFELEPSYINKRRMPHHNGNEVCDCAKLGYKPCMVNGDIGKKILDENGKHVGWETKARRPKRIKK